MEKLARLVERLAVQWPRWKLDLWSSHLRGVVIKEGYSGLRIEFRCLEQNHAEGHPGVEVVTMPSTWSWVSTVSVIFPE